MFSAALRPATRAGVRAFSTSNVAARDVAKMTLIGRLGVMQEKEHNGKPYVMYKIATTDKGRPTPEGEEYQKPPTSWHTIFASGPAMERVQAVEVGSLVMAECNFTVKSEKDETTGQYSTTISANHDRLTVLKRPQRSEGSSTESTGEAQE